jgi:hypothetical protein
MNISRYKRKITRIRARRQAMQARGSHLKDLYRICLEHISPITCPIVLISQIQRSGGSLISQLFDGHPQIHGHPDELMIGHPKKYIWPQINLNDHPSVWFKMLFEENVIEHFKKGYTKGHKSDNRFPFIFLPALQKKIFINTLDAVETLKQRDVFDAYMTSYFGAWINYQNLYGSKRYITGFTPRLGMVADSIDAFFKVYPDGRLISSIRDPKNWFPSAHRHTGKTGKYADIRSALSQWVESAQAMVRNKERYGNRVCIIRFEDLIRDTAAMMRHLAAFLDLDFDDILLQPTFNKSLIAANTSFKLKKPGIMTDTLNRHQTLTDEELGIIDEMTRKEYQKIGDIAAAF